MMKSMSEKRARFCRLYCRTYNIFIQHFLLPRAPPAGINANAYCYQKPRSPRVSLLRYTVLWRARYGTLWIPGRELYGAMLGYHALSNSPRAITCYIKGGLYMGLGDICRLSIALKTFFFFTDGMSARSASLICGRSSLGSLP